MEVHQHTHTPRKKWTHYFWEFLMLFLAVTLGFFVENQREHLIEHKREKQYIKSMILDLKADTAHLQFIIRDFEQRTSPLDTVLSEFSKLREGFSGPFFRNASKILGYEDFIPNDRTIQQLKNAGGMRLIKNPDVSDSIMTYDKKIKDLLIEQSSIFDFFLKFKNIGELLDVELWVTGTVDQLASENKKLLLTTDKTILGKYHYWFLAYHDVTDQYLAQLKDSHSCAVRLIIFLKQQYHLN